VITVRGASVRRLPFDPDDPSPQPAFYPPIMPAGHAVLAGEIIAGADPARQCPPERLRGLCEAYVSVAGLSILIRDEDDVADVVSQARQDYADWEAHSAAIGRWHELHYYLRLTQQQEDAGQRMEELTRLRGVALAEYQRQTGASLRQTAASIRQAGYAITASGISWLVANSAP
jgi:hypothetical protein